MLIKSVLILLQQPLNNVTKEFSELEKNQPLLLNKMFYYCFKTMDEKSIEKWMMQNLMRNEEKPN